MTEAAGGFGEQRAWGLVFAAWLIATVSTLGALFFGEVMHLPTCVLCWYQRIFMFPLALILPLGLFPFDRKVIRYGLVLAVPGALVALFHQLLVAGVVPESIKPCVQGVPCSQTVISWFGFLTIPLLSVVAFSVVVALLAAAQLRSSNE
ncbi:MAG TPA: disulfide bond formation protein B [Aromatoleum sp.]|uniref:disulfide bond formation protein B n=1 Tax=Aromatoleum sp. TaxID=2307007 RepID=UPI002B4A7B91|nr:disulfide bond formation protein B [Aromatoleum sp.]HJV25899.1 disulfide bond formation protein B [Aromatoleum sp.]